VEKFSEAWEAEAERAFCLSSERVEPMICFTWPAWRSMHGRNFMVGLLSRDLGGREEKGCEVALRGNDGWKE